MNYAIGRPVLQENKQEAKQVWKMFKKDPLSPASSYWRNFGMPGIGLFLEGYVVSLTPRPYHQWLCSAALLWACF